VSISFVVTLYFVREDIWWEDPPVIWKHSWNWFVNL